MREKDGLSDITVSLEEKEARVTYAPEVLTCHQVAEAITGVAEKFTACVISDSCRVEIRGMTCQSCVRNIETFLSDQPGVESVVVSLERATATVGYDWSVTDQHIIAGRTHNSELRTHNSELRNYGENLIGNIYVYL